MRYVVALLLFSLFSPLVVAQDTTTVASFIKQVRISSFEKRIADKSETFLLQNNTDKIISRVYIRFSYYTLQEVMISYREITVEGDIAPGTTKQFEVDSFDQNKRYFYYLSKQANTKNQVGFPFKIKARLLRYDTAVLRPAGEK